MREGLPRMVMTEQRTEEVKGQAMELPALWDHCRQKAQQVQQCWGEIHWVCLCSWIWRSSVMLVQSPHHWIWHTQLIERCLVLSSLFLPQPVKEVVFIPFYRQRTQGSQECAESALLLIPEIAKRGGNLVLRHVRQRAWVSQLQDGLHPHWMSASHVV